VAAYSSRSFCLSSIIFGTSQSNRSIDTPVGKHRRHEEREHNQRKDQEEILSPLDVFNGTLCFIRTLLFFPKVLPGRRLFHGCPGPC
jgi:hypothetical protein